MEDRSILSSVDQKHAAAYERLLDFIRDRTLQVANRHHTGCLIFGRPGTGKTYTVKEELERRNARWQLWNARMSPMGLWCVLQEHPDETIVVDDVATLFTHTNKMALQILLAAGDGQAWQSPIVGEMSEEKPPDQADQILYEIKRGWERFWALSTGWKVGTCIGIVALVLLIVVAVLFAWSTGGNDDELPSYAAVPVPNTPPPVLAAVSTPIPTPTPTSSRASILPAAAGVLPASGETENVQVSDPTTSLPPGATTLPPSPPPPLAPEPTSTAVSTATPIPSPTPIPVPTSTATPTPKPIVAVESWRWVSYYPNVIVSGQIHNSGNANAINVQVSVELLECSDTDPEHIGSTVYTNWNYSSPPIIGVGQTVGFQVTIDAPFGLSWGQ